MKKQNLMAVCLLLSMFGARAQTISTVAGNGTGGYMGDGGAAISAELQTPIGVSMDGAGNMYIADQHNNCVRKVTSSGTIATFAGSGTLFGFNGDGGAAISAKLFQPNRTAVDGSGNVYIIDAGNSRIRKVDASGTISTFAGNGTSGYTGDGSAATAAEIAPEGIITDAAGNVYIGAITGIRKIDASTGIITTIAGNPTTAGYSGDGGAATAAEFYNANDLVFDASGTLYICDQGRIRKINTSGIISSIAGNGTPGNTGDGGSATAASIDPTGIAITAAGNIYFSQTNDQVIRTISTSGAITKYAGNGVNGFSGDGGFATTAELAFPAQIAIGASGSIYIADQNNDRIRKISSGATFASTVSSSISSMQIYPNPIGESVTVNICSSQSEQAEITITNAVGEKIKEVHAQTNAPAKIALDVPTGIYFVFAKTATGQWCEKICK